MSMMNQNNCPRVVGMLSAIFKQYRGLNLNCSKLQLLKKLMLKELCPKIGKGHRSTV